jgi:8-oxo-dGTP pyrophosphatase MutT (NUDIX family)
MKLIKKFIHSQLESIEGKEYKREASRAIVLDGENILLLYTQRYNDYSFPGGGLEEGEDKVEGLIRELEEETGAKNINIIKEYGYLDEFRPSRYEGFDYIHMISYFYVCDIDKELGKSKLEDYEIKNGMEAKWINIYKAIKHNKEIMEAKHDKMGVSIERETFMLELIAKELIENK